MSIEYTAPPQSRNEAILADTINDVEYTDPPQSRIEDLLIDLNGKVVGKQDALTEEQLAAVNSGIDEEKVAKYDDIYAVMNYNALNHNGIYRGKDLTNIYTVDEIYERVHNGTFEDLYLGDYFTVSISTDLYEKFTGSAFESGVTYYERSGTGVLNWVYTATSDVSYDSNKTYYTMQAITEDVDLMIASFNYFKHIGFHSTDDNHIILIPKALSLTTDVPINPESTSTAGYINCEMHLTTLPCYATSFKTALNNHILTHEDRLTSQMDDALPSMSGIGTSGASTNFTWEKLELELMNEIQLFGTMIWSSSALECGMGLQKFQVFNFVNTANNHNFWLRTISGKDRYVKTNNLGLPLSQVQNGTAGVCPLMMFG